MEPDSVHEHGHACDLESIHPSSVADGTSNTDLLIVAVVAADGDDSMD